MNVLCLITIEKTIETVRQLPKSLRFIETDSDSKGYLQTAAATV